MLDAPRIKKNPLPFILLFYVACFAVRALEYFVLRTDQSAIGEAIIHKAVGILLLAGALALVKYRWSDIGFGLEGGLRNLGFGLLFGLAVYGLAYGLEMILQSANAPYFSFYVASYSTTGNSVVQTGLEFVLLNVVGNVVNVVMEEGVFRGLFIKLAEEKYSFIKAALLSAVLFGFWHIAQPVRNVADGLQSPGGAFMMGLMLVCTSGLGGFQYALLYKMTGSQYFGMAAHFVNNAIVNLLHVVTVSGADEMQTVRITVAQSVSFVVVLIVFLLKRKREMK